MEAASSVPIAVPPNRLSESAQRASAHATDRAVAIPVVVEPVVVEEV